MWTSLSDHNGHETSVNLSLERHPPNSIAMALERSDKDALYALFKSNFIRSFAIAAAIAKRRMLL